MALYISGSLAFDRIMTFNGNFQDHVLMDKLHMLNISFLVDSMDERPGGCAGNIAYSLALLGEKPVIVSTAGHDFANYAGHLSRLGLSLEGIRIDDSRFTALGFITTDLKGNQITGFYPGAMQLPSSYSFPSLSDRDIAIVSPGNMDDMQRLPDLYREKKVPFIYDPGQQLPLFTAEMLTRAIDGAFAYTCNDYELGMTCKTLGIEEEAMLKHVEWLVTTRGEKGVLIRGRDGSRVELAPAPCREVLDPTGAGDAQRSGLLFGLSRGLSVPEATKIGCVTASFAIERLGTQEHQYTLEDFRQRYEAAYGALSNSLFA